MGNEKWDFDKEAASWDKNPRRVNLANDIAAAISDRKILNPDMDVLEFGCGTGLLTLRLRPLVHSVTGVDSSRGMLGVLKSKIEDQKLANVGIQFLDPARSDVPEGSYHAIVCSMTLHHVRQTRPLIDQFYRITAPHGYIFIADLDPEGGKFHGENDTVFHCGFDRAELRRTLMEAGFDDIGDSTAANVLKPDADGAVRSFSVFLMTGRKRG
jgi:ubiquinone/menaquinone biosynthesis C-methylase UbiE